MAKRACGNETIDSQHGTGVEGRSHSCTEGYHPKEKIFAFNYPHVFLFVICAVNMLLMLFIFFSSALKISHAMEI